MKCFALPASGLGERIFLGAPIEAELSMEEGTPADGFRGIFPWKEDFQNQSMAFLEITGEGGKTIFSGPIDEIRHSLSAKGNMLEISARSEIAVLLDNEAVPQTYAYPSLPLLFEDHGKPYGFTLRQERKAEGGFAQPYPVTKGMSEWEAMDSFCRRFFHAPLKCRSKDLYLFEEEPVKELAFGKDIPIASAFFRNKIYERYSEILLRPPNAEAYARRIRDEEAAGQGIFRRRLLSGTPERAREELKASANRAFSIQVVSPSAPLGSVGDSASLEIRGMERYEGLYIAEIQYICRGSGESCRYILRRKG